MTLLIRPKTRESFKIITHFSKKGEYDQSDKKRNKCENIKLINGKQEGGNERITGKENSFS